MTPELETLFTGEFSKAMWAKVIGETAVSSYSGFCQVLSATDLRGQPTVLERSEGLIRGRFDIRRGKLVVVPEDPTELFVEPTEEERTYLRFDFDAYAGALRRANEFSRFDLDQRLSPWFVAIGQAARGGQVVTWLMLRPREIRPKGRRGFEEALKILADSGQAHLLSAGAREEVAKIVRNFMPAKIHAIGLPRHESQFKLAAIELYRPELGMLLDEVVHLLVDHELVLDSEEKNLYFCGRPLPLSHQEFRIFAELALKAGEAVKSDTLIERRLKISSDRDSATVVRQARDHLLEGAEAAFRGQPEFMERARAVFGKVPRSHGVINLAQEKVLFWGS